MSLILFLMSLGSMSHVDFKKGPCRPVEFRGQGPYFKERASECVILHVQKEKTKPRLCQKQPRFQLTG